MDTEVHPELINSRFAYVSISRASRDAQIYTNNAATLGASLSRDVSKSTALNLTNDSVNAVVPKTPVSTGTALEFAL
jgi:hypothetical protein